MAKKLTREQARQNLEKGLRTMKRSNSWEDARYLLSILYAETCLHLSGVPFPPFHHEDMKRVLEVYGEKYEAMDSFERTRRAVAALSSRNPDELYDPCPQPKSFLQRVFDRLRRLPRPIVPGAPRRPGLHDPKDVEWKIQGIPYSLRWLHEREDEWVTRGLIR